MNKSEKQALKVLCQSGALGLIAIAIDEVKKELTRTPEFTGNTDQLVYDSGKMKGVEEGLDILFNNLSNYAQE